MQVYNTFMKIVKKQLNSCIIYLVIFLVLATLLANMGWEQRGDYKNYECKLAIFDMDQTKESEKLAEYLAKNNEIVEVKNDLKSIEEQLYFEEIDYVLYIEEGFAKTGSLSNIKRPGSNTGVLMDNQIDSYLQSMKVLMENGYSTQDAYEITEEALSEEGLVKLQGKNTSNKPKTYYYYLYIPYVMLMMMFSGLGPVLVAFNRREVSDRVNISATSMRTRNMQLVAGIVTFAAAIWGIFVALSFLIYGKHVTSDNMGLNILNAFVFTVVSMGLVSIIGNFNLAPDKISMISNIFGLGMSFLGGVFVPMEIFGAGLMSVAKFLPTYWYVVAQDKMIEGAATTEVLSCIGVEALFAVVFVAIGMLVSKRMKLARTA